MKKIANEPIRRRAFLKRAAVAGAALGAGAASTRTLADTVTEPAKPVNKGYRETDHIREYYKSARF